MNTDLTLTPAELVTLTGYQRPGDQLRALHEHGFVRARLGRLGDVILERAHYDAVCRGQFAPARQQADNHRPRVATIRP